MKATFQFVALCLLVSAQAFAAAIPIVDAVDAQPLSAQVKRVTDALTMLGAPLSKEADAALQKAMQAADAAATVRGIQEVLDPLCLAYVNINPEMRVKLQAGAAKPVLEANGWRVFLLKVHNEAGATSKMRAISPNAISRFEGGWYSNESDRQLKKLRDAVSDRERWLDVELYQKQPLKAELSGLKLEYAVLQLSSRDAGSREAKLMFDIGQGTQDLGSRNELDLLFQCLPSSQVTFDIRDEKGAATMAALVIRDAQGRIYPSRGRRLAPDFGFHDQVYRTTGEKLDLPAGTYQLEATRGPEYLMLKTNLTVGAKPSTFKLALERWIDPSAMGWWSGDHHIHAAGCAHYVKPTEGVLAADMIRHCFGEDLKVGCNLTWGPCFDFQKQFFCGATDKVSHYPYLLRYDIEVSGFGSHESGHLCLLRLQDQMFPGGTSKDHWPRLGLNTLKWAKKQGAVTGPAHSGAGLEVTTKDLPNYVVPPFSGIGANEYIVDVTHEVPGPDGKPVPAIDFISTVDTPIVWELNIWYHTLNAGFRTRISGETDFPCVYGERVGLGRSYVKLGGKLDFDAWCEGIREGRNYVGDGRSHLLEFKVNGNAMGENGSEVKLAAPGEVIASARVAALLDEEPNTATQKKPYTDKPYWDVERARIGATRRVPVELIVNGFPVASQEIEADGQIRITRFAVKLAKSSWVALRVLGSSHTNPIFVTVGDKPIRASRKSVEWCLKGVDQCWSQKERFMPAAEMEDAKQAYAHAREVYRARLSECDGD